MKLRRLVSFVVTAAVAATGLVLPVSSEADALPDGPIAPTPGVELVEQRTANMKVFTTDEPGRFQSKVYSGPVHFLDGSGGWAEIDSRLVADVAGRVRNAANAFTVDLGLDQLDLALGRIALDAGHSIAFAALGALPGTGVMDGNKVSYQGVWPGVDMRLSSQPGGLKEDLVLASRDVPDTYLFPLILQGLTASIDEPTGDVLFRDETGVVRIRTPRGWMEDANVNPQAGEGARSDGVTYELVSLPLGQVILKMRLDRAWLDAPERVFPVTVDPNFHPQNTQSDDTYVQQPYNNNYSGDFQLKAGTFNGGTDKARSMLHFHGLGHLDGKSIDSATLWLYNYHSFSCSPRPLRIHRITDNWDANTYRTFPGANFDGGWFVEENFAKGYTGCGADWQGFNVHTAVHNWTHGVWPNQGLLVVSPNEGDSYGWKKFYSWNQGGDAPGQPTPHLDIYWNEPNRPPNVPDLRQPDHGWFGGGAPQLSARLWDPDGNNGNVDFEIAGVVFQPVATTHGSVASYTPNLGPGTYSWRVRAWDGQYVSAWSDWWTFTVNSPPYIPDQRGPGSGWVGTSAPTLSARYTDPNGNGGNVDFEVAGVVFQPVATSQNNTATYRPSVGDGVYSWRVRAWDGQHVSAWSDWWTFTVDGTAPSQPGVSASPHTDPNTWYRDTSTTFSWGASDTSGINAYSWAGPDTSSTTTPDDTSEGTGNSKPATLAQGTSWFHVKARNGAGLWGQAAHFKVNVDATVPAAPLTCSSTSSHGLVASGDQTIDVSWQAGSDSHSGVAGYATAFIRTGDPGEAGTTVTRTATTDTSAALADGSWTFHVKTIDRAGNASANKTCGPFVIDGTGPAAPAISSSTHVDGVWDADRDGLFSWNAPADASGVNGYSVEFNATDTGPDNTADAAAAAGTWAQNGIADGTWYLRVKAKDTPGNWGSTGRSVVKVDASPPGKPTVTSPTGHTAATWSKDRTASFSWSGPTGELSGISGYSWSYDQNPTTVPDTTPEAGTSTTVTVAGDGNWYFHVRARNGAGVWGTAADVTHHQFKIDTVAPTAPLLVQSTSGHAPNFASSNRDLGVVWTAGTDADSGVDGYATAWTNTQAAGAGTAKTTGGLTASKAGTVDGEWWFHVRTVDLAGNASGGVAYGPFFIDASAPSDPIVLASTLTPEIVAQSDEIGLEQWSPYRSMPLGGNGTGYVNLRSGNLAASFDDASVPGQGLNTVVRHTYNSRRSDPNQHDTGLGLGWTLSVADLEAGLDDVDGAITDLDLLAPITVAVPRIVEGAYTTTGYMLEFTDGDGTTHRFTRNGQPGSRWQSPPGVSLRIREVVTNGVVTAYQLIRPDGVIYEAKNQQGPLGLSTSEWKITTVSDRNSNVLTFDYAKVAGKARPVAVRHNRPGVGTVVSFAWDMNTPSATYGKLLSITSLPDYSAEDPGTGTTTDWGRRTDFGYSDSLLTSVVENAHTDPAGGKRTTTFGYDVADRLASVTDPRGGVTSFTHTTAADGNRLAKVTDRRNFGWNYAYGAAGAKDNPADTLTTVTSPIGAVTTYELSPRGEVGGGDKRIAGGNIARISDAGQNDPAVPVTTRYAWSQNRMMSETDGAGAVSSYQYNDLGLVTQVTEPATNDPARSDLPASAVAGPVTSVIEWSFPTGYRSGNCTDPAEPSGSPVSKHGYCHAVAEMTRTKFADNHGDAQRRVTDFAHGPTGNLLTVTQRASGTGTPDPAKDRTTTFEYYTSGALRSVDGPLAGTTDKTAYGNTGDAAYGGYDRTGLPASVKDPLGFTKSFWYTPYGQIGRAEDRDGKLTWSRFDGRDNLVEVVRDDDADRARDLDLGIPDDLDDISRYEYDANDWKVKATSGRGTRTAAVDDYTTISCYDAGGLLLKTSGPGANGAAPLTDPCSTANIGVRLSDRVETLSAFNSDGTKSRDTNPTGGVTDYEHYPNTSLKLTRSDTAGSTARAETLHLYDPAGRLTLTRQPAVNDAGSRPEAETVYTPAGTVAARKETTSTGGRSVVEHAYNAHGEAVQTRGPRAIDGVKAEERHTINRFGEVEQTERLVKTVGTPARWITTAFGYDQAGHQTSVTQATGTGGQLTSTYTFDALGQLKEQTADPVNPGHTVAYEYSGEGQQTKRTDKVNGAVERASVYSYNHDNTQASLVVTDKTGKTLASCNYEAGADPASGYDADGNLLVTRTISGTNGCAAGGTQLRKQTLTWDGRNELAATTQTVRAPSGAEVTRQQTFAYTAAGDVSSAAHHAKSTSYSYSPAGWLTSMTDWRNKATSLTYQPSGAPKTQAVGGAANGTFTYHPDGSVKDLTWKATGLGTPTVRAHTGLTYDEGGLRTAENVAVAWPLGTFKSTAAHLGTYSYDLLDRLAGWQSPFEEDTTVNQPATTQTLDDGGNATAETVKAGTTTRSSSTSTYPNGRLATKATTVGTTTTNDSFVYNSLGEEISRTETAGTTNTGYDPMGHSARVDQPGTTADVDYVYDTADRLISRTETIPGGAPQTTLYFYWGVGGSLAEETTDTGTTKVRYLVDSDQEAIGQEKVNGTSSTFAWMLPDTAGNPATYTNDSGGVVEQAAFDPYGKPDKGGQGKDLSGGATPTLGFQGAITDKATGNVVLGARLYDPTTARFTTPDTFVAGALDLELGTDSLTGNRYLFAGANPVSFYEDGHWGLPKLKLPNPIKALKKVAKKAVPALGFVPVVGTGIDVISAATGRDLLNGGRKLSGAERALFLAGAAAGLVPGAGTAAKAGLKTAAKATTKAKTVAKVADAADALGDACRVNSFVPGTLVLLADGTSKPIEDIQIGDQVLATDPVTGETTGKPVTDLITGHGLKELVDVTIDGQVVTATAGHPFYVQGRDWVDAADLRPGDHVRDDDGDWKPVEQVRRLDVTTTSVHNLTVADIHTYYVHAGDEPVLVHNCARPVKSIEQAAKDLVKQNANKNRVSINTPSGKYDVDLAGRAHAGLPTPHTKFSERHIKPGDPRLFSYTTKWMRATSWAELRVVRRILKQRSR